MLDRHPLGGHRFRDDSALCMIVGGPEVLLAVGSNFRFQKYGPAPMLEDRGDKCAWYDRAARQLASPQTLFNLNFRSVT